ncbi:MAG: hypothetical protein PWR27_1614 [Petroclostridium sp.]|jgi:hypothetical protein|nr:hypothetical protein [Petroclostridium sp.]
MNNHSGKFVPTGGIKMKFKKIRSFFYAIGTMNIINKKTERFLALLSLVCIFILIIAQIGLVNETTRTFFTDIDKYEGVNINNLHDVFKQGELSLKLIGMEPNNNIKVLLNGTPAYEFKSDTLNIKARNNCLIEIDGTKIKSPFKVKIVSISENISTPCKDKEIEVNSNIQVLTRIFLK